MTSLIDVHFDVNRLLAHCILLTGKKNRSTFLHILSPVLSIKIEAKTLEFLKNKYISARVCEITKTKDKVSQIIAHSKR